MVKNRNLKLNWAGMIMMAMLFMGVQGVVADDIRAEQSQEDILMGWFGDEFVSADEVAAAIKEGLIDETIAAPTDQDLVFTPVTPCRIVDTRLAGGPFTPGARREFYVYGTTIIANQGGNPAGCASPRGEPSAVHINVTAVPQSGSGYFGVFPANVEPPNASLVNYKTGVQNIANAATIKTYYQAGAREIEVINRNGSAHLVIDVMGYYYAAP